MNSDSSVMLWHLCAPICGYFSHLREKEEGEELVFVKCSPSACGNVLPQSVQ